MPRIAPEKCHHAGAFDRAAGRDLRLPYDDYAPLPAPDQSRYGPPGTTDSPRYLADGVTRRPNKGDEK